MLNALKDEHDHVDITPGIPPLYLPCQAPGLLARSLAPLLPRLAGWLAGSLPRCPVLMNAVL